LAERVENAAYFESELFSTVAQVDTKSRESLRRLLQVYSSFEVIFLFGSGERKSASEVSPASALPRLALSLSLSQHDAAFVDLVCSEWHILTCRGALYALAS